MLISINTAIPTCSKYFLFVDVPYRFAARHLFAAFEQSTPRPLKDRVCHAIMGSLLILLPIVNLVIAAVECYLFPTTETTEKNMTQQMIRPNHTLFPATISASNEAAKKNTTPQVRMQTSLAAREAAWRTNPHILANHIELHPSKDLYKAFFQFNPFQEMLLKGDETTARCLIQDPHFKGLNAHYSIELRSDSCTEVKPWLPLIIAAHRNHLLIFELLLQNSATDLEVCAFSTDELSPLIEICKFGPGYEIFINKLIEKGASPFLRGWFYEQCEISALELAEKSNVASETCAKLQAWHTLNKADKNGNSQLQQAVEQCDLFAFKAALEDGVCLNNRNWHGQTALHLAISKLNKAQHAEAAREMIRLLLEKSAQLNLQNIYGETPLLQLVDSKPPGWEDLAISLLGRRANPNIVSKAQSFVLQLLLTYPSTHPVKGYLLKQPDGVHSYYQNQFDLATLLSKIIHIDIGGKWELADGGNYSEAIYELLADVIGHFLEDPTTCPEMQEMFSSAKGASALAQEIAFMSDPAEIVRKIQDVTHPILIASGWTGHAISLTIYKNQLICANVGARPQNILGGLRQYEIWDNLFEQTDFPTLIKHNMCQSTIVNGTHYYALLKKFGCHYERTLELPDQTRGNCTWASSALLGLRSVLEIQNRWESEKIAKGIEQFNQFAQSFLILKTVNHLKENISKLPLPLYPRCLSSTAYWLCNQIQKGNDSFGYYRKGLDAITFSGFRLDETAFFESPGLIDFYANLYTIPKQFLKKSLMENQYHVGSWLPL